jgi:hypothetical protein
MNDAGPVAPVHREERDGCWRSMISVVVVNYNAGPLLAFAPLCPRPMKSWSSIMLRVTQASRTASPYLPANHRGKILRNQSSLGFAAAYDIGFTL